ncbi:hypothetical protein CQA70_29850, partial [Klebsiella pneumoniae]
VGLEGRKSALSGNCPAVNASGVGIARALAANPHAEEGGARRAEKRFIWQLSGGQRQRGGHRPGAGGESA